MRISPVIAFCFLAACGGSKGVYDAGVDADKKDANVCTGKVGTAMIAFDDGGTSDCMQACTDQIPAEYAGSTVLTCSVVAAELDGGGGGDVGYICDYAQTCNL